TGTTAAHIGYTAIFANGETAIPDSTIREFVYSITNIDHLCHVEINHTRTLSDDLDMVRVVGFCERTRHQLRCGFRDYENKICDPNSQHGEDVPVNLDNEAEIDDVYSNYYLSQSHFQRVFGKFPIIGVDFVYDASITTKIHGLLSQ